MKKKILFVIPEYSIGGTNTSLTNLLSLMNHDRYDISVYCLYEDGAYFFKEKFKNYIIPKSRLYYWAHDNKVTRKVWGVWLRFNKKANFNWLYSREAIWLQKEYKFDTVIAYQEATATNFVSFFRDTKKIAWIHCDYPIFRKKEQIESDTALYSKFDDIVTVSLTVKKSLQSYFPNLANRISYIYNTLNIEKIKELALLEPNPYINDDCIFNIVSVGRLSSVKNFHLIPSIVRQIKNLGIAKNFRWYIVGDGVDGTKEKIQEGIYKYGLQETVIMLGNKKNPYPYIRNANLLVCLSKSESFSYVLAEAKTLHVPVLSNNFPVAYEVIDEHFGWVCSLEDMPQTLSLIIQDKYGEYRRVKKELKLYEYDNNIIIKEVEKLLDK